MADRFPLIVDADNTNIKELPSGDNLDLTGSDIVNVVDVTTSGNMVVGGNLTVNGTTTTINSATLTIDDKNIVLASGAADAAAANGAGITIDGASANLLYSSSTDGFSFNKGVTVPSLTTTGNISFGDNDKAVFGAGSDLQIYHDGSASYVEDAGTGNLRLKTNGVGLQILDGSDLNLALFNAGSGQSYLYNVNGGVSTQRLATTTTGIDVTGTITFDGGTTTADINFGDNDKAVFGAGSDLQIFHNGLHSYVTDSGTGDLKLYGANVEIGNTSGFKNFLGQSGGGSFVYYNNALKLATTTTGIDVTGVITTDGMTTSADINFGDDDKALFGAGNDLKIYHSANNQSYIHEAGTGDLNILASNFKIQNGAGTENKIVANTDGAVSLYYDNSAKLATTSYGVDITGRLVTTSHIDAPDNAKIRLGDGDDLQIYHSGSHSFISEAGTGDLYIGASSNIALMNAAFSENKLLATTDGALKLYYDGSQKLSTTSTGIDVTGTAVVDGLTSAGDAAITGSSSGSTVLTLTSNALADTPLMVFERTGGAVAGKLAYEDTNTAMSFGTTTNHELKFLTNNTARAQFTGGGNLLLQTDTVAYSGTALNIGDTSDSQNGVQITTSTTGNGYILFGDGSGADAYRGQIQYEHTDDKLTFRSGGAVRQNLSGTETVFNEGSTDTDFRVESDGQANMLFVEAQSNRVGIAESAPESQLHIKQTSDIGTGNAMGLMIESGTSTQRYMLQTGRTGVSNAYFNLRDVSNSRDIWSVLNTDGTFQGHTPFEWNNAAVFNEGSQDYDFRVESAGNENMLFVDASMNAVGIGHNAPLTPLHVKTTAAGEAVRIESTNAGAGVGPQLGLFRNSGSPAAGDQLGQVVFYGEDSASNITAYASIVAETYDVSNGTEDGRLILETIVAGSAANRLYANVDETVINEGSLNLDFRVESSSNTHALFVDAGNSRIGINDSSPSYPLDVNGAIHSTTNVIIGDSSSSPGTLTLNDNSTTAYTLGFTGTGTRAFEMQGSASSGAYGLTMTNLGTGAFNLSVDGVLTVGESTSPFSNDALVIRGQQDGTAIKFEAGGTHRFDLDCNGTGTDNLSFNNTNSDKLFTIYRGQEIVVNEDSLSTVDFRVESDTQTHMLFVDAGANSVGINNSAPSGSKLSVLGASTAAVGWGDVSDRGFLSFDGSGNPIVRAGSSLDLKFQANSSRDVATFGQTATVFNEPGNDQDFRVESDTNANAFFLDATNGNIGMGGTSNVPLNIFRNGAGNTELLRLTNNNTNNHNFYVYVNDDDNMVRFGSTGDNGGNFAILESTNTNDSIIFYTAGGATFNELGADSDFRVESSNNANMLFVDASTNRIGINTSGPNTILDILDSNPTLRLEDSASGSKRIDIGVTSAAVAFVNAPQSAQTLKNSISGTESLTQYHNTSGVVVNESGADRDFRVESNNSAYAVYVDAAQDSVGILTNATDAALNVNSQNSSKDAIRIVGSGGNNFITGYGNQGNIAFDISEVGAEDPGKIRLYNNGGAVHQISAKASEGVMFNDGGMDMDFRVESNNNANMLVVDAGTDRVGIGGTPTARMQITSDGADAAGAELLLKHANNNTNDVIATVNFANNTGSAARIRASTTGANNTGLIQLFADNAGTDTQVASFKADEIVFNETSANMDFRVESDNNTHALFVEGSGTGIAVNDSNTNATGWDSTVKLGGGASGGGLVAYVEELNVANGSYIDVNIGNSSINYWTGMLGVSCSSMSNGSNRTQSLISILANNQFPGFNTSVLHTADGSSARSFTVAYVATGTIRITNTSGDTVGLSAWFTGGGTQF